MGYFRELPNLEYQSFLDNRNSSEDYLLVKNFFRRVRLRDDLQNIFTLFNKYTISDNSRPDNVAEELFEDPTLDWVVLIVGGITNIYDQWPLSNNDLYNLTVEKYGIENLNATHHHETTFIVDEYNRLIMQDGLTVSEDFTIPDPSDNNLTINPTVAITNLEYETRKNDAKRQIYVLKPEFLNRFLEDSRSLLIYKKSNEYINKRLIRTFNTRVMQLD
jgi:hypothetical protein